MGVEKDQKDQKANPNILKLEAFLDEFLFADMFFSLEKNNLHLESFVIDDNFKRLFMAFNNGEVNNTFCCFY